MWQDGVGILGGQYGTARVARMCRNPGGCVADLAVWTGIGFAAVVDVPSGPSLK